MRRKKFKMKLKSKKSVEVQKKINIKLLLSSITQVKIDKNVSLIPIRERKIQYQGKEKTKLKRIFLKNLSTSKISMMKIKFSL